MKKFIIFTGLLALAYSLTDNQKKKINTTAKKGAKAGAGAAKKMVKKTVEKFKTVSI